MELVDENNFMTAVYENYPFPHTVIDHFLHLLTFQMPTLWGRHL